jgi:two-component system chemotaxis sensor kinase CheA
MIFTTTSLKNTETNYIKVPGIAGATILGDGRVALIIDIAQLVAMVDDVSHILISES